LAKIIVYEPGDGITLRQSGFVTHPLTIREVQMNITTIGIDLATTSYSLAGTDKHGGLVRRIIDLIIHPPHSRISPYSSSWRLNSNQPSE
jgi:hypothetical protein